MRLRGTAALALVLALVATMVGGPFAYGAPAAQNGAPIRLKAVTFNPAAGERPQLPAGLARLAAVKAGKGYYLLQFAGPVQQAWKDALSAGGAEFLDYVPDYAFKVRMTPALAAKAVAQANVTYVGLWHPFYSIDPAVLAATSTKLLRVKVERGGNGLDVANAAAGSGATVVGRDNAGLIVAAERAQIDSLAQAMDVAWVEPYVLYEKHDEYARTIIGANVANATHAGNGLAYDGSTQIAAVADTGIGGGTAATAHPDIPASRVVGIFNWPGVTDSCFQTIFNDGAVDVDSGHGTHVAGSVLSDGTNSPGGLNKGIAPAARLVFQATENYVDISALCAAVNGISDDYYLTGLNDLYGLFQQAYNAGARIHANSWGAAVNGDYNANSVTADDFIWDNKDFTITFSAGNEGIDANADGVIDNDSIGAPATAKNVITIGASENNRQGNYQCDTALTYTSRDTSYQNGQTCGTMSGINFLGTYGQRWAADYPAAPISTDLTAENENQMAAFSSRGPTDDGRIKPDVVAPGTWILSTYSSEYQEGYGDPLNPRNSAYQSDGWGIARSVTYKYFGGTSMSNPIAAGAATVVRDYYQKVYSIGASAALVKATLINSAVDMTDENNDGVNDNDFPIPNVHEGWGRINLVDATDGTAVFTENTTGLSTGGSASTVYTAAGGQPLKVTLVWSDFASTAAATVNLVNNLDLTVTGPGGVVYRGNIFSGGWSATGGTADNRNNVENVYIQTPTAGGSYTVAVSGFNVPNGPQPFAVVVRGAQVAPPPPAPAAPSGLSATASSSSQINLSWTDASSNEDGFRIERCQGAGCSTFAEIATVAAGVTSYNNSGLTASTSYSYRVRAYNTGGNSAYSNTASATTLAGPIASGYRSPTANAAVTASAGDNNGFQTNPTNAYADDGLFAIDTNSGTNTSTSCTANQKDKHVYYNYGFSVPTGATINGIQVRLDGRADATGGAPRFCVQLSWNGGTSWTTAKTSANLTTTEATYTLGGTADNWGRTWSAAEVNSSLRVRIIPIASNTSRDFSLDWVAVQVNYQ